MLPTRRAFAVAVIVTISVMADSTSAQPAGSATDQEGVAFFEARIRPVLVKECYSCHSAESKGLKGGLRLDHRAGILTGGDSGPALVPGKPEESLILEALRQQEGLAMPPKGKLPERVIDDFSRWITIGAPDPRTNSKTTASTPKPSIDLEAGRKHWAYQPIKNHHPPLVSNTTRDDHGPLNSIDAFLLHRLQARELQPNPEADPRTLARRAYFDLLGRPPTPEEIDDYLADDSRTPAAFEALVDRLLASPQFGERWGRHWLDVARFAESLTLRGFILKEAWRYRDYVIESFNHDRPFRQFVVEQLAGDLLPATSLDDQRRQAIAVTFLTLGNTNLEEQDKKQLEMDVVDEQLDTLGKAFLAQTIGCARCHDHKFDPIPTRDYYALAGILKNTQLLEHANVSKWIESPLPMPPERELAAKLHEQKVAALEAQIKQQRTRSKSFAEQLVNKEAKILAAADLPGVVVDDAQATRVGAWKESNFSGSFIGVGYIHDDNSGKGEKTLTFAPELPRATTYEVWLAYSPGKSRASNVSVTIFSADGEKTTTVDMKAAPRIAGRFLSLGRHRFERNGQGFVLVSNEGTSGHVTADAVVFLPADQLAQAANTGAERVNSKAKEKSVVAKSKSADTTDSLERLEADLKTLKAQGARREMVMAVKESAKISDTQVHIRGSVHTLGEPAPRGVLRVATWGQPPTMPSDHSGRLELAEWMVDSRANPLTARVIVNRVWHWLFGEGLVRTTDNFGTTGETPSHPELLDALAARFVALGWSTKSLIREIMLSHAYRQSSADQTAALASDPENRLLWRMNRRRLEAECLRDAMLCASGNLSTELSGANFPDDLAADYGFQASDLRRSVYTPVFRNAMPEIFEVFDFADPSIVVGRRNTSTVAPQALFLMNHPFVSEEAEKTARRLLARTDLTEPSRVDWMYQLILGRPPSAAEQALAIAFVSPATPGRDEPRAAWTALVQSLFASMDFRYRN